MERGQEVKNETCKHGDELLWKLVKSGDMNNGAWLSLVFLLIGQY